MISNFLLRSVCHNSWTTIRHLASVRAALVAFSCLTVLASVIGCSKDGLDADTSRPDDLGLDRTYHVALIEEGEIAYARHCTGCHGAEGDGNGEAAKFLHPKPRNFVSANFKFSSTRSGQLPTDEDLHRTIKEGLKGSAMPPFDLLPERTREALVAYIKTFSPKWKERMPASPIPFVHDPYLLEPDKSEAIARGEEIYHGYAMCWNCHPAYVPPDRINKYRRSVDAMEFGEFREDLDEAVGKENTEGQLIYPPDFKRDFVRAGMDVADLYRSIAAGITGTAMPTWVDSMDVPAENPEDPPLVKVEDLWAMAYYVRSLIQQRPQKLSEDQVVIRERKQAIYLQGEPPKPVVEPEAEQQVGEDVDFGFD
ncbi:MAG: cytochrome c [Phycisphaerales bacterium]|nr:cytochrome c [Phycisphaerales bacterium]